ncbi:group 1 glycosyl transferase [Natronorubrum bangense JCM 10635]|uniref:Group 1 glycosyl transferase n=2 Tax=Natronorubrum bangense TaxID=61858 RepID=L9W2Y1_9EURY|nr:group 1 glycosyl transferase [Natronorubrum bangense JCM 10635]
MKVLNLVTTPRPFFNQQCDILRENGIEITTLQVPGRETQDQSRSLLDFVRFYPHVLDECDSSYDIVHANFGLTAPFALLQPHRPVVLTLWGTDLMGKYGQISRVSANFCDEVILPSSVMSEGLGVDHKIVPFGVDKSKFKPINKYQARKEIGWENEENILLFPYTPSREVKNYKLAEDIVASLSNDATIKQISDVSYNKMPLYMNASDAILITSKRESGPMVVKEAALCNVPVVSTDVGFTKDVLCDVSNSTVSDDKQKLVESLDFILSSNASSDGREILVDEVSVEKMGDRLINIYKSLM